MPSSDQEPLSGVARAQIVALQQTVAQLSAQLETEQRRLAASQRLAGVLSFEIDLRTGRTWVSDETFRMLGIEPTTFDSAEAYRQYLHPDDAQATTDTIARHAANGTGYELGHRFVRRDGTIVYAHSVAEPVFDATGTFVGFSGTTRDVTREVGQHEELRRSERLYRLIFRSSPQPMWVYDLETLGFLEVNDAALYRYGYTRAEFLQLTLKDIRPEEDLVRLAQVFERPLEVLTAPTIWRHRTKNGEVRDVQVTSHDIDWNGRPARLVLPVDITEQLRTDRELREQAALLEKARDGIVLHGTDGIIRQWNGGAARIFGYAASEALGQQERSVIRFVEPLKADAAIAEALERGGWNGELRALDREGTELILDVSWTVLRDGPHAAPRVLSIYTDITGRKRIEGQFLRAQRLESIGTLAGGIAHDLNNMLSPIVLSIDLLRGEMSPEEYANTLDTIERSARRGSDLVRQVLSFARGVDGERTALATAVLIEDIARLSFDTFPRSIRIRSELRGSVPAIIGDATQLHQVLLNLCVNARDAMPSGGTLTLVAERIVITAHHAATIPGGQPGSYVRISVTDSGTGIAPDIRERIFEPFFTTKDVNVGTGLGLSTVQAIIRSHGGFVNVYSEPGSGTTFNVYLPADVNDQALAAPTERRTLPRGNGELILVVDDEAAVRGITQQTLEAFGYRTIAAADGAAALALWVERREHVSLVLTDVMMPIMDGPSLIRAMMHIDKTVRIISASGLNANGGVARAAGSGVRHFLPKPYSAETLLIAVREALDEPRD